MLVIIARDGDGRLGGGAADGREGRRHHQERASAGTRSSSSPARSTAAEAGKAQTILVLGSDHRFTDPKSAKGFTSPQARSDTMMLVRLDPTRRRRRCCRSRATSRSDPRPRDPTRSTPPTRSAAPTSSRRRSSSCSARRSRSTTSSTSTSAASSAPSTTCGRLRRRRPVLLPLQRRPAAEPAVLGDQRQAGLPEARRLRRAGLRALPPHRQRTSSAPPASRTSCARSRTRSARAS